MRTVIVRTVVGLLPAVGLLLAVGLATAQSSSRLPAVEIRSGGVHKGTAGTLDCTGALTCSALNGKATMNVGAGTPGPGASCAAGQALTFTGGAYACTSNLRASDVACSGQCVSDAEIAGIAGAKVSGAVAAATSATTAGYSSTTGAFETPPLQCHPWTVAKGISASGDAQCGTIDYADLDGAVPIRPNFGVELHGAKPSLLGLYGSPRCAAENVLQFRRGDGDSWECETPARALGRTLNCPYGQAMTCNGVQCYCTPAIIAEDLSITLPANKGGTGNTIPTVNTILVGTGSAWARTTLPACSNAGTQLQYNSTSRVFTCGANEAWTLAALTGGWVNFDLTETTYARAQYRKALDGRVYLRGLIRNGTVGSAAFTLPAGNCPAKQMAFPTLSNGALGLVIVTAGTPTCQVTPTGSTSNASLYLDAISYFPD